MAANMTAKRIIYNYIAAHK